ncbi:MAG: PQQ-binding-like beta-propeller repeat protein [Hyphomonadaceae bacterium]|nr:PQQ-binding-like beta-propeller repeat protein [Hyphomonadaceae bacterium]
MRNLLLLLPAALALAGCGLFGIGGGKKQLSAEEIAARITVNPLRENLTPDPALAATTVILPEAQPATDWPQAGVNASKIPGHLQAGADFRIDWRAGVTGTSTSKRLVAAPVAKDGKIYVIDANQVVTAFETDNGRKVWTHELQSSNEKRDNHSVGGGLAIAGDRLIVSSGFAYIEALALTDGKSLWRRRVDSPMSGSPAVLGNRAFVTSSNNDFYALDIATGDIIWNDQAIAETARVLSSPSPAVTGDILAVPYSSGELIAYLPANGRRLWNVPLTTVGQYTPLSVINDIAGRPSIQDGVVYAASHSGVLAAIDARSGSRLWETVFGSRLGPVIGGDYLFVVGTGGKVVCFNRADGKVVWVRELPEFKNQKSQKDRIVWTGPLLASNRLIIASSNGDVLALSPQNGETVADLKVGQPVYIEPIAASGKIFVLTDKGTLVAIR